MVTLTKYTEEYTNGIYTAELEGDDGNLTYIYLTVNLNPQAVITIPVINKAEDTIDSLVAFLLELKKEI